MTARFILHIIALVLLILASIGLGVTWMHFGWAGVAFYVGSRLFPPPR